MQRARIRTTFVLFTGLALLAIVPLGCGGGAGPGAGPGPGPGPGPAPGNPTPLSFVNWETPPIHPVELVGSLDMLYLAHTADHRLEAFDVSTGVPVWAGSTPVGLSPVSVRHRAGNEVWVANHTSDTVSVVDTAAQRVVATLQTLDEPTDIVFAGSPERAFVCCSQANAIQVFDPSNLAVAPVVVPIDAEDPRALAVSPDGNTVYAAVFESGNASTVLGGGGALMGAGFFPPNVVNDVTTPHFGVNPPPNDGAATVPAPNPGNGPAPAVALIVKKDALGRWMDDNAKDWTPFVSGPSAALSGRPVGWDLPDRDVAAIDANTLGVTYAKGLMNLCMALGMNPVTGAVAVVGTDATNEQRFEPNINGRFLRVNVALVDAGTLASTAVVDLNPHLTYATPTVAQNVRNQSLGDPRGIAWNTSGSRAFVTGMGSDNIVQVDANGARAGAGTIEVGAGPTGLAFDGARNQLYVWNRFGGSISVIDVATETEVARVSIFDPTPPVIKAGRPHLYDTHATSGLGHVACASCHADARVDRLAWDLGDPSGDMEPAAGNNCQTEVAPFILCPDYHPQKGPMTTQTLQDIIGHEPHHWRGDRTGIEAFNPAFQGLMGDDAQLTSAQMQEFEDFLATIAFPPNPFRNMDNTLPTNLPLPGQFTTGRFGPPGLPLPNGDAVRGLALYRTADLDGGVVGAQCVTCHTLPTGLGTDHEFNLNLFNPAASTYSAAPLAAGPDGERHLAIVNVDGSTNVSMKVPQLRNMHEKVGFDMTQTSNNAGFGFLHDGSVDSLARFVSEPLFSTASVQDVADLVAFMMSFAGGDLPQGTVNGPSEPPGPPGLDTHAGVGRQHTYPGGPVPGLLDDMVALAQAGAVDLIVKGVQAGENRGWLYDRSTGLFLADRDGESVSRPTLEGFAGPGSEQTWTLVPEGLGVRLGIDRDEDGFRDNTETDAGSDPTSQNSTP